MNPGAEPPDDNVGAKPSPVGSGAVVNAVMSVEVTCTQMMNPGMDSAGKHPWTCKEKGKPGVHPQQLLPSSLWL